MDASCAAFTIRGRRTSGKRRSYHAIARLPDALPAPPLRPSPETLRMSQLIVLLALVFAILIAAFAVQNTTAVSVQFLTFQVQSMAVSVLVLISAALGALAMLLLGLAREIPIRWRHRAVAQQLKASQARVAELEAAQAPKPASTTAELKPSSEAKTA